MIPSVHFSELHELPIVAVDIEGNGRQPPEIVEVSAIHVNQGFIGDSQTWLIKPNETISRFATSIHGISNADVQDSPQFSSIRDKLLTAISGRYLLAHNASVEMKLLSTAFPDWKPLGVIDTLKISRILCPYFKNHKLDTLISELSIQDTLDQVLPQGRHRALYDAMAALLSLPLMLRTGISPTPLTALIERGPNESNGDVQGELF